MHIDVMRNMQTFDLPKKMRAWHDQLSGNNRILADLLFMINVTDKMVERCEPCLLYTSDAADERSSVDLGGRRIIKKKKTRKKNNLKKK